MKNSMSRFFLLLALRSSRQTNSRCAILGFGSRCFFFTLGRRCLGPPNSYPGGAVSYHWGHRVIWQGVPFMLWVVSVWGHRCPVLGAPCHIIGGTGCTLGFRCLEAPFFGSGAPCDFVGGTVYTMGFCCLGAPFFGSGGTVPHHRGHRAIS